MRDLVEGLLLALALALVLYLSGVRPETFKTDLVNIGYNAVAYEAGGGVFGHR